MLPQSGLASLHDLGRVVLRIAALGTVLGLRGCSEAPSCEESADRYVERYNECKAGQFLGSPDGDGLPPACTNIRRQTAQCLVFCVENAPCTALREEDQEEERKLIACQDYCSRMFPVDLKARAAGGSGR